MNPPLRTEEDRQALLDGLCDGTIDAIATDHAPHTQEEKEDFFTAPNGVVGLETSFAASYTALVKAGKCGLPHLVRCMSRNPREILGLPGGEIRPGAPRIWRWWICRSSGKWNRKAFAPKGETLPLRGRSLPER